MKLILLILLLNGFAIASDKKYLAGEKIYKNTCISCHGKDGSANTGIHFIVNPRNINKTILNEEQTYKIIKNGAHFHGAMADIMPSFKSVFKEDELRNVNYYITKSFNTKSSQRVEELYSKSDVISDEKKVKMFPRGKKIYKRNCSWCHGLEGKGDGSATRNPEMSIFPYDLSKSLLNEKQMFLYVKHGGKYWGTSKNDMPGWGKKYDDFTIKSLVHYIKVQIQHKSSETKK